MIVETEFCAGESNELSYYKTILDATEIVELYESGKNIVFHFPENEDPEIGDTYIKMATCSNASESNYSNINIELITPNSICFGANALNFSALVSSFEIDNDGKLRILIRDE